MKKRLSMLIRNKASALILAILCSYLNTASAFEDLVGVWQGELHGKKVELAAWHEYEYVARGELHTKLNGIFYWPHYQCITGFSFVV